MNQTLGPFHPRDGGIDVMAPRTSKEDFADFSTLAITLWRRKLQIAAGGFAAALLAAMVVTNIPSIYVAHTEVQLDTRERQVINIANVVGNSQYSDAGILSEIAVLRSPPILRDVALRLDLAQHEEFYPTEEPTGYAAVVGALRSGLSALLFGDAEENEDVDEDADKEDGGEPRPAYHVAADFLRGKVNVSQVGLSYILRIDVSSENPGRALAIANAVAEAYLRHQVELKVDASERATEWLSRRVEELRERVELAETEYERSRAELARAGGLPAAAIDLQLGEVSGSLMRIKSDRALAMARARRFAAFVDEGAYEAAMRIASSPVLDELAVRRANILERRGVSASAGLEDGAFAQAFGLVETRIAEEARSILLGLQTQAEIIGDQETAHLEALRDLELALVDQSAETIDLRALEREVQAQRSVYQTFLTRLTEARERGDFQEPDAQIVSLAEAPRSPASPNRTMITVVAFLLGCGVSLALVILNDARRRGYRTAGEAQARTGHRVIAVLPKNPLRLKRWRDRTQLSLRNAVYRLRLLLDGEDRQAGRSVMIASTLPGEASGELAALLAQACGLARIRVAFVDLDSSACGAAACVAALGGEGELSFENRTLSGGVAPRDAAPFLVTLRESYDLIVVHAPPVLADAETLVLARLMDHVVLAFQWEKTPDGAVIEACEDLVDAGAHLVGLVMTETNLAISTRYEYRGALEAQRACARYNAA